MLDGVVLARKTGLGALRRPVLVALGLDPDGKKEVLDYRLATAESAAQWELFLSDLYRRGLEGKCLEMICTDGGTGLLAALPTVYPNVAVQRCWAHKIRNLLDRVRKADQPAVKMALHNIMNASNLRTARSQASRFRSTLAQRLSQGRQLPAHRPRRYSHLFPLPHPGTTKGRAHHQCHRTQVP